MGGTTAKASMVEDGEVMRAHEYAVGAGIMIGSRLLTGAGYTLKVPAIDLAEVGAGGGSHIWIDAGGALQVGPESAGAVPGPVCYDTGGEVPTITDANVILGYLNPAHLIGGALKLNAAKARRVFAARIAEPLDLAIEDAAYGAHEIAASNMIRAIKAVSTERGRDPREFALFAFGGNGPLFACGMAALARHRPGDRAAGARPVLVLRAALCRRRAPLRAHVPPSAAGRRSRRDRRRVGRSGAPGDGPARGRGLHGQGRATAPLGRACTTRGRASSWSCRCRTGRSTPPWWRTWRRPSGASTRRTYGHRAGPEEPVELVSIQVVGQGLREGSGVPERVLQSRSETRPRRRRAAPISAPRTAGSTRLSSSAPSWRRAGQGRSSSRNTTPPASIPPGATAELDAGGNIVIEL